MKKYLEALVLYERLLKYAKEVQSKAKSLNNILKDLPDVQQFIAEVNAEKYSLKAAAILDTDETVEVPSQQHVKDNIPICNHLETFYLDPALVGKQPNLVQDFQPSYIHLWTEFTHIIYFLLFDSKAFVAEGQTHGQEDKNIHCQSMVDVRWIPTLEQMRAPWRAHVVKTQTAPRPLKYLSHPQKMKRRR
ncbi:signal recognition particle subunit SRP68-like [Thunnus albacares]|uniref:signal recognition particle subunit SRP68-like n=1 Tax=Thunnus albacares TaxID=8236 RepID=UPI001CF6B85C|nr:signal recognition particle subunit SRP68-like [Thunnus albacares]